MELRSRVQGGGAGGLWGLTPVLVILAACLCYFLLSGSLGADVQVCSMTTVVLVGLVVALVVMVRNFRREELLLLPQGAVLITGERQHTHTHTLYRQHETGEKMFYQHPNKKEHRNIVHV